MKLNIHVRGLVTYGKQVLELFLQIICLCYVVWYECFLCNIDKLVATLVKTFTRKVAGQKY